MGKLSLKMCKTPKIDAKNEYYTSTWASSFISASFWSRKSSSWFCNFCSSKSFSFISCSNSC